MKFKYISVCECQFIPKLVYGDESLSKCVFAKIYSTDISEDKYR